MEKEVMFKDFRLKKFLFEQIERKGFERPSEIQTKIIPEVLDSDNDIIGVSHTGSGKTASFALPILNKLRVEKKKVPKVIVLAPTRELALQVSKEIDFFKGKENIKAITVYGGTSINVQIKDLKRGVDIVVGTPGRVLDLIKRDELKLGNIEYFVLDEADEMLNMGFIEDIESIFKKTPEHRRVLLFSATMPSRIIDLAGKYMKNRVVLEVENKDNKKLNIEHKYMVTKLVERFGYLCKIIRECDFFYGIVFAQTKADVNSITLNLRRLGFAADCIHGDIVQNRREKILNNFRAQKLNILVATDVAARGIDVKNLTHVVNMSLPKETESYVHRIGRVGRAGKEGTAITLISSKQKQKVFDIEREIEVRFEKMKLGFVANEKLEVEQVIIQNKRDERRGKKFSSDNKRGSYRDRKGGGEQREKKFGDRFDRKSKQRFDDKKDSNENKDRYKSRNRASNKDKFKGDGKKEFDKGKKRDKNFKKDSSKKSFDKKKSSGFNSNSKKKFSSKKE